MFLHEFAGLMMKRGKRFSCGCPNIFQPELWNRCRIVAMMMVLILHLLPPLMFCLGEPWSASYNVGWLLRLPLIGVNCYALITGYVCCDGTFRYERVVSAVSGCFLYMGSLPLALLFFPQEVQLSNILHSLFPVLSGQYWYVICVCGLFFFIPFLNALGNRLTKLQFQYLLVTVFVLFSVIPTPFHTDVFPVEEGYSICGWASLHAGDVR
ncbi:MAG: hypothetical protein ACLSUW_00745 [Akkermansia sp.]